MLSKQRRPFEVYLHELSTPTGVRGRTPMAPASPTQATGTATRGYAELSGVLYGRPS